MLCTKIEPVGLVTRTSSCSHALHQFKYSSNRLRSWYESYCLPKLKGGSAKTISTHSSGSCRRICKQSPKITLSRNWSIPMLQSPPAVTSVPIGSPMMTLSKLPGTVMLKTMIGMFLSQLSENAVVSMTFTPNSIAFAKVIWSNR